jgi:hypothetical protein
MNVIMNQIDELKKMQQFPRSYLSNYFDGLKRQIDLKCALNLDEQDKYLEIIKIIESFEQDAYKTCRSFSIYDKEIKSIEDKLNVLNLTQISKLIDELKYKIEREIFSNKSIFFFEELYPAEHYALLEACFNSFLVIINDEYIRKERSYFAYYHDYKILTREKLKEKYFQINQFSFMKKKKKMIQKRD